MNMSNDRIYIKRYKLCKKVNTNKMKVEIKERLVSKVKSGWVAIGACFRI